MIVLVSLCFHMFYDLIRRCKTFIYATKAKGHSQSLLFNDWRLICCIGSHKHWSLHQYADRLPPELGLVPTFKIPDKVHAVQYSTRRAQTCWPCHPNWFHTKYHACSNAIMFNSSDPSIWGMISCRLPRLCPLLHDSCFRILVGVSNGIVSTSIFTVEVCSPDLRGTFSMLESVLRWSLLNQNSISIIALQV